MFLILKNIKSSTTVVEIDAFIKPALVGGFLKKAGWIESIHVQQLKNVKAGTVEFNAIVLVKPYEVGKRVIKMLNRKPLDGKYINVAEFQIRLRDNDRRKNRYKKLNTRREADRRRDLEVVDITEQRRKSAIDPREFGWHNDYTL